MKKLMIVLAALALTSVGSAAWAADVNHGRVLADRWCAGCHVVGTQQRQSTEAPAFDVIARTSTLDASQFAYFLMEPHPKMPSMTLSRTEAADLAAFIKSLKK